MKIVINKCYGGFGLDVEVVKEYFRLKGWPPHDQTWYEGDIARNDKDLILAIETVGIEKSAGPWADLKIVEVPDDVEWTIEEHDGIEWIAEKHRTWE